MRIRILREQYCARCKIKAPRSTGVRLLLETVGKPPQRVLDFGCSTWRNSKYLENLGAFVVRVDALPNTRPDIVAYPTYMPIRQSAFDTVLFTHIFMFLQSKQEWPQVASELVRISKGHIIVEAYRVRHKEALTYEPKEIENLFKNNNIKILRKYMRQDLQILIIST
jgi:tellurite methyltransferase